MNIFFVRLLTSAVALWGVAQLGVGLSFANTGPFPVLVSALVLGFVNATIRPMLVVLTLPFTFITFGFFLLVINAITISLVAVLTPLNVANFWGALVGGGFLTVTNIVFQRLLGTGRQSDKYAGTIAGNAPTGRRFNVEFGDFNRQHQPHGRQPQSHQPQSHSSRDNHVYQDEQDREIIVEKVSRDKLN